MLLRMMAGGLLACVLGGVALADEKSGPDGAKLAKARQQGVAFLKTSQRDDGSWTSSEATGITALVTHGAMLGGAPVDDPAIAKALAKIAGAAQEDGRICSMQSPHAAYETAVAVMALAAANKSGKYTDVIKKADGFLRGIQYDESRQTDKNDNNYGGAGYGPGKGRPDLSNTVFFVEALTAAGAKPDDPDLQKALQFISKCQNLESEHNTTPPAAKVNDGGFYYTVAGTGNSPAGRTDEGGLRSYGSMTYAGLKSMIYAGLEKDDKRVKAATGWIKKNYTVEENPGMGANGLYYYYYLFAKALDVVDDDQLVDEAGKKHDWRKDLADQLIGEQKENGSWVNGASSRFMEGDPNLVTAYALTALYYCDAEKK